MAAPTSSSRTWFATRRASPSTLNFDRAWFRWVAPDKNGATASRPHSPSPPGRTTLARRLRRVTEPSTDDTNPSGPADDVPDDVVEDVVIIGAGPAGLTAAYHLVKAGKRDTVLEADSVVGGISRTVERDGWRFDIGGHRFFTKVRPVEQLWHEILPDEDFMLRPRMSRILYRGKFYDYPLRATNALRNLGVIEALRCV